MSSVHEEPGGFYSPPSEVDPWSESDRRAAAEQDEVDSWLSLPAAAARCGVSPNELAALGQQGILDVREDRSGRPRLSLEQARFARHARDDRYADLPPDERWTT
jgi:hypothetical protein